MRTSLEIINKLKKRFSGLSIIVVSCEKDKNKYIIKYNTGTVATFNLFEKEEYGFFKYYYMWWSVAPMKLCKL